VKTATVAESLFKSQSSVRLRCHEIFRACEQENSRKDREEPQSAGHVLCGSSRPLREIFVCFDAKLAAAADAAGFTVLS
jgi:hypothetical protein